MPNRVPPPQTIPHRTVPGGTYACEHANSPLRLSSHSPVLQQHGMAVPGFLTNYISRNYRRLLVCVRASREDEREREHSDHHSTNINTNQRERRRPTSGCFSVPGDMYQEPDRDEVFQRGMLSRSPAPLLRARDCTVRSLTLYHRRPAAGVHGAAQKRTERLGRFRRHGLHADLNYVTAPPYSLTPTTTTLPSTSHYHYHYNHIGRP